MNFRIDRFEELQLKSKLSTNKLEIKAGLGKGTVKRWKDGTRTPSAEALSKAADVLGCDLQYLWGLTDVPKTISEYADHYDIELSPEEKLLLDKFRQADTEGKFKIIQAAMNEGEE